MAQPVGRWWYSHRKVFHHHLSLEPFSFCFLVGVSFFFYMLVHFLDIVAVWLQLAKAPLWTHNNRRRNVLVVVPLLYSLYVFSPWSDWMEIFRPPSLSWHVFFPSLIESHRTIIYKYIVGIFITTLRRFFFPRPLEASCITNGGSRITSCKG